MIDFLFLMLALFATLAVSRAALYDSEVELTQLKPEKGAASLRTKEVHQIHLSIASDGSFKWLTEFQQYPMETVLDIQEELAREYKTGLFLRIKLKQKYYSTSIKRLHGDRLQKLFLEFEKWDFLQDLCMMGPNSI